MCDPSKSSRPALRNLDKILVAAEEVVSGDVMIEDVPTAQMLDELSLMDPAAIDHKRIVLAETLLAIDAALVASEFGNVDRTVTKPVETDADSLLDTAGGEVDDITTGEAPELEPRYTTLHLTLENNKGGSPEGDAPVVVLDDVLPDLARKLEDLVLEDCFVGAGEYCAARRDMNIYQRAFNGFLVV